MVEKPLFQSLVMLGTCSLFIFVIVNWVTRKHAAHRNADVLAHARAVAGVVEAARQTYTTHRSVGDSLPIEFARDLASRIRGSTITIYSKHPFPQNEKGGLKDQFGKAAWKALTEGKKEYVEFQKGEIRYAAPDVMSSKCVECHNSHQDTPKDDWEVGDVRGVIEVQIYY